LETEIVLVSKHYGTHYHRFAVNAQFVTLIFVSAYEHIIPSERHCAVGKESGKTNHIERFNLTLRQRVSRLL